VLSAMSARDTEALWREASPSLAEAAAGVSYSPCWALMAAFTPGLQLPYQVRLKCSRGGGQALRVCLLMATSAESSLLRVGWPHTPTHTPTHNIHTIYTQGALLDSSATQRAGLSWIANNSSKPGRPSGAECWVAHADMQWTQVCCVCVV